MEWLKAKEYILQGKHAKLPEWDITEMIGCSLNESNERYCRDPKEEDMQRTDWEVCFFEIWTEEDKENPGKNVSYMKLIDTLK